MAPHERRAATALLTALATAFPTPDYFMFFAWERNYDKTVVTKNAVPADAVHVGTQNFLPGKASPVRVDIFLLYNS